MAVVIPYGRMMPPCEGGALNRGWQASRRRAAARVWPPYEGGLLPIAYCLVPIAYCLIYAKGRNNLCLFPHLHQALSAAYRKG